MENPGEASNSFEKELAWCIQKLKIQLSNEKGEKSIIFI
jgi:hypothetical protein